MTNQPGTDRSTNSRSDVGRTDIDRDRTRNPDANPDPITGAPGSHPIGTGVGAAAGGAAGAAVGSIVPGIGTVIGGVVGAIVGATGGGLVGKEVAESINPSAEDAYWRENYKTRPYYSADTSYDDYAPAYRYGWESRSQFADRKYNDVESDLGGGWEKAKANSRLGWEKAKAATRDAWDRADRTASGTDRRDVP
jgi:hypothetical protein